MDLRYNFPSTWNAFMVQGMRGLDMPLATDGLCLVEESSLKIVSSDLRITGIDRFRDYL